MKWFIISCFIGIGSSPLYAIPTQFTNSCSYSDFHNSTNSEVLFDHQNCQKMYVKPPMSGEVSFDSFTESSNLGFCASLRNVFSIVEKLDKARENLLSLIEDQEEEIQDLLEKKQKVEKDLVDFEKSTYAKEAKEISRKLEDISLSIESYIEDYEKCDTSCSLIAEEIKELKKTRLEIKKNQHELRKNNRKLAYESERLEAERKSLSSLIDEIYERLDKRQELVSNISSQVEKQYRFYAQLEGGLVNLSYRTNWDQNLKDLNERYKGLYHFQPIPTRNARIHMGITGLDKAQYLNSLPILLDYSVNGMKGLFFGDNDEKAQSSLSSSLTGFARLSLVGACPIKYKNFLEHEELIENKDLNVGPMLGVSLTYDFPSNFKFNVKASYNLYKFYEKIESSVGKGGLFSRKLYHSTVENRIDEDSFSIDWNVEDTNHSLDWEKRKGITKVLKEDLIQRVLNMTATPVAPEMMNVSQYVQMPTQNGADRLADSLKDLCWGSSAWCRGTSFMLKGLSSIFSRSEARDTFRSKWNRKASERWSENISSWRSGATAFTFSQEKE